MLRRGAAVVRLCQLRGAAVCMASYFAVNKQLVALRLIENRRVAVYGVNTCCDGCCSFMTEPAVKLGVRSSGPLRGGSRVGLFCSWEWGQWEVKGRFNSR